VIGNAASGVAIYGAIVATGALFVGLFSSGWNIYNAITERRSRRRPDVHGVVVVYLDAGHSEIEFANAGPSLARQLTFLLVENSQVYQGSTHEAFLGPQQRTTEPLPFKTTVPRSSLVWAYMDADHNVHAKSNNGDHYVYEHPAKVEIGEVFQRFYPTVTLPPRGELPYLGEL
jgi:hypothetical protein